jgi:NitT/TauT family transport system substrate-binding protein
MTSWKRVTVILAVSWILSGCGSQTEDPRPGDSDAPQKVRLALNWFPEAEHGGYYAAEVHGYYEEAGLEVEIIPGGPGAQPIPRIAAGDIEFGVDNADNVLTGRARGAPVTAVMAPLQISPRCIMVHESSGIESLYELENITLAITVTGSFSLYLRKKVPLENVTIVPYSGNVAQFLLRKDFAQQAYVFSEPFAAEQKGARTRCLLLSEIGFNPYTSVLITDEDMIRRNPDIVKKMVGSSVRGWSTYMKGPARTNAFIHGLNPEMDPAVLEYGAEAILPLMKTSDGSEVPVGHMVAARWESLLGQLEEIDVITPGAVDPHRAFTSKFLDSPDD